jgi:hypothetical protein
MSKNIRINKEGLSFCGRNLAGSRRQTRIRVFGSPSPITVGPLCRSGLRDLSRRCVQPRPVTSTAAWSEDSSPCRFSTNHGTTVRLAAKIPSGRKDLHSHAADHRRPDRAERVPAFRAYQRHREHVFIAKLSCPLSPGECSVKLMMVLRGRGLGRGVWHCTLSPLIRPDGHLLPKWEKGRLQAIQSTNLGTMLKPPEADHCVNSAVTTTPSTHKTSEHSRAAVSSALQRAGLR